MCSRLWLVLMVLAFVPSLGHAEPTFQDAFEKHNATMLLIDPGTGAIKDANAAASRFYGHSRLKLRTMTIQDINMFSAAQVAQERKLAQAQGRNFFIFRHALANGEARTVEVHSVPLDFDGQTLLYSIIRDISKERELAHDLWHYQTSLEDMVDHQTMDIQIKTQQTIFLLSLGIAFLIFAVVFLIFTLKRRQQAEVDLRVSERLKRQILDAVPDLVWLKDVGGVYQACNPMCERALGMSEAGIIGKTDYDFFTDDQADAFRQNDKIAMETDQPVTIEVNVGGVGHVEDIIVEISKTAMRNDQGEIVGVLGVGRDITNRKKVEEALRESEERFRSLLNSTAEAIYGLDLNGNCTFCNPASLQMLGFEHEEDFLGKNVHDLIHHSFAIGEPRLVAECEILNALKDGKGAHNDTEIFWRQDGSSFPAEYWSHPIRRNGRLVGSVVSLFNITERKQAKVQLTKAKEEAESANHAKSEFLASMSHELRTPLNAVLGFAQMLQFDPKGSLSQGQNETVEHILEGGSHLLELINEILDLVKIESDQFTLVLEEVDANALVVDCIDLSIPLAERRNIEIVDQLGAHSNVLVRTDAVRFKQVLINLLSNAINYNKDGGTVTVTGVETEDGYLRICVADTGVGIAKADFQGLFQVFHRLGADSMIAREGTGIGLAVSKLLVERMAGRIGFDSEQDVGSTFWFELPMASNKEVLIWTRALRVGVEAIDQDHQILVSMLNTINHKSLDEQGLDEIIGELIDYIHYHFKREEAVMEACDYPDLIHHRVLHDQLTDQVGVLASKWQSTHSPELLEELQKFLSQWLFGHILNADMKISGFTRGKSEKIKKCLLHLESN